MPNHTRIVAALGLMLAAVASVTLARTGPAKADYGWQRISTPCSEVRSVAIDSNRIAVACQGGTLYVKDR